MAIRVILSAMERQKDQVQIAKYGNCKPPPTMRIKRKRSRKAREAFVPYCKEVEFVAVTTARLGTKWRTRPVRVSSMASPSKRCMIKNTSTEKNSSEKIDEGKKSEPEKSEDADAAQSKVQSSSSSVIVY
jgi:hypothetical protein